MSTNYPRPPRLFLVLFSCIHRLTPPQKKCLPQVHACLATAAQTYSPDFLSLLQTLLFKPPDVEALCAAASSHTMDELTSAYAV